MPTARATTRIGTTSAASALARLNGDGLGAKSGSKSDYGRHRARAVWSCLQCTSAASRFGGSQMTQAARPNAFLVRREFGQEGAAYVQSYLDSNAAFGKRLGRLLARRDIEAGSTWALVPADSPPQQIVDFEDGLFPNSGFPIMAHGGVLVPKFNPASSTQIQRAVADLMAQPGVSPRLVCAELIHARRDTPLPDDNVFYCGDDVYAYQTADAPVEAAAHLPGGATWRPSVAMITSFPTGLEGISNGSSVGPEVLDEMATTAVAIMVGAWDDEAFLFWEPKPKRGL